MNSLNSILIEGLITSMESENNNHEIVIKNKRYFKTDGVLEKEYSYFDIQYKGKSTFVIGDTIRAIGRIKQHPETHKIFIIAERVEMANYKKKQF